MDLDLAKHVWATVGRGPILYQEQVPSWEIIHPNRRVSQIWGVRDGGGEAGMQMLGEVFLSECTLRAVIRVVYQEANEWFA